MNTYTWTYVAGGGRNYNVGLYHGSKSGHLVIYVGSRIVTLDFRVLDSKEYTFFIEDELCHIQLERRGAEMFYHFNIDRKADTPRNRARNAMERKFLYQLLITAGIFALIVGSFVTWSHFAKKKSLAVYTEVDLLKNGVETVGKVTFYKGARPSLVFYQFVAGTQALAGSTAAVPPPDYLLINGMPLESGDEFIVTYVPLRADVNRIDFDRPTQQQVEKYRQRAAEKYAAIHVNVPQARIDCLLKTAFQLKGIGGLADFYFQDAATGANAAHNRVTFQQLIQSKQFVRLFKQCS